MEDKTFIQLGAMGMFAFAVASSFKKGDNASLRALLLYIIGWLMLIYCKL